MKNHYKSFDAWGGVRRNGSRFVTDFPTPKTQAMKKKKNNKKTVRTRSLEARGIRSIEVVRAPGGQDALVIAIAPHYRIVVVGGKKPSAELQKIAPTYRDNQMMVNGKIYAFPDDGDVFVMYYRKDLFADPGLQKDFKAKYKYDLAPPKTWKEFGEIGQFLTEKLKAKGVYGASQFREPGYGNFMFQERFRNEGGKFFDANMKAQINNAAGVKVFSDWKNENKFMPPGVEKFGFVENLATFLKGESAMTISWPPYGRFAAGYIKDEAMKWVPESKVSGKVGYALPPGGHPELAAGFTLGVASTSKNKELAYLFIQWLNSEEISMKRVQLPFALRDPFRDSHFTSKEYMAKWPDAKDYLAALQAGSKTGLLDLSLIQTDKYEEALRQGISRLWAGEDPKKILDDVAKQWDDITAKVGIEKQKAVYNAWAAKSGAYPK